MNYAIDRIIENIAICENIETGEKIEITTNKLPKNAKEGNIITDNDGEYILNPTVEKMRRKMLREKLNRLKALRDKE